MPLASALQSRSATNNAVSDMVNAYGQAGNTATDTVNKANSAIQNNANGWTGNVIQSGSDAADWATDQANKGVAGVNDAVNKGQSMLQPYSDTGTSALSTLSNLLQKPQQFNYQADPGYQFRLSEGQKQISRMAAAHGAAGGGGTAKAAAQYSSGLASQEYGNAWNRWNTSNQERQNGLATVAGMGERAGEYSGDLGMRGSQFNAGLLQNAAQYGGNMKVGTTQWAGNLQSHATDEQAGNSMDLGNFLANLQINQGKVKAGGQISRSNIWNNYISETEKGVMQALGGM